MSATQQDAASAAVVADFTARAFIRSCRDEVEALKPGNVHVFADGHGMTVDDFLRSADAAAPALCAPGAPVGARILGAVRATFAAVGLNTNLGIVLLCAPLAAAAELAARRRQQPRPPLRAALREALAGLTRQDAQAAFDAIVLASPGGLGAADRQDVRAPARVGLLEAMGEAAGRDRIAFQYADAFSDVFGRGLEALKNARGRGLKPPWLASAVYLEFLAAIPDTHISRKFGADAARATSESAEPLRAALAAASASETAALEPALTAFDHRLKADGLNPGTSADLTAATLFADRLNSLIARGNDD